MDRIKCVVIGDSGTGKTSLIRTFTTITNPGGSEELHSEFAVFKTLIKINGTLRELDIYDILTNSDHGNLAPILFSNANLFLICFSVLKRDSFVNARHKWLSMVLQYNSRTPVILIGTKIDLRIPGCDEDYVTRSEGMNAVKELCLNGYFESTSLEHKKIKQIFKKVIKSAMNPRKPKIKCKFL